MDVGRGANKNSSQVGISTTKPQQAKMLIVSQQQTCLRNQLLEATISLLTSNPDASRFTKLPRGGGAKMAVGQKSVNGTLVSGNMDENLRFNS